jgi:flagellar basal body-associated protein FliL
MIMMGLLVANSAGMRNLLLVLVLLAIVLLITGATIALMTFYKLRKAVTARTEKTQEKL